MTPGGKGATPPPASANPQKEPAPPPPQAEVAPFDVEDDQAQAQVLNEELENATVKLKGNITLSGADARLGSWDVAAAVVKKYRPVPWILWRLIHGLFGKPGKTGKVDPIAFDLVRPLILNASKDKTLMKSESLKAGSFTRLDEAADAIELDVCAALCVVHGVCRRISVSLAERVRRPILDDALMRAQIGYHVGRHSDRFGRGRGILAGFSGRSGLAVLIASGDMTQAQRALEGLASGMDIRRVGITVYGCDPLQVAAMTLSAAGCSIEAAFGVASFSGEGKAVNAKSEEFLWLSAFAISEHLRMGTTEQIEERYWEALGYQLADRAAIKEKAKILQRKGPSWGWIIAPQKI